MRRRVDAIPPAAALTIYVNGRGVRAHAGETVHAALVAAGRLGLRKSRQGEPRGVFCGMGVCYECRVTIDGIPDQRACMRLVAPGMRVEIDDESR